MNYANYTIDKNKHQVKLKKSCALYSEPSINTCKLMNNIINAVAQNEHVTDKKFPQLISWFLSTFLWRQDKLPDPQTYFIVKPVLG